MMNLHLLVGIAVLLSTVEESTSATSITVLDCGGIKFQHELYTQSELPADVGDTDLTLLIPWLDPSQVRQLELSGYGIGAYIRKSYAGEESLETLIGHVFSHGYSQIYVPRESDNPGGFARLFFENYLLTTARRYRIIVLSLPEDSHSDMSSDSLHTLTRLMSLPAESSEVNLVVVGGGQTPLMHRFHGTDHHTNYIRNVIKSCKECPLISVKRWAMTVDEASKNFPVVPYVASEFGSLMHVLQHRRSAKSQNMRSLACLQLDNMGGMMTRNQGPHNGNIEGLYPYVPETPKDHPHGKISHSKPNHNEESPAITADKIVESLLPNHNEKDLLDALDALPPMGNTRSDNLRQPGEAPIVMYKPYEKCQGNVLLIYGDYFPLEIKGYGCEYKTVLVRSTIGIQVVSDISLPGKNLIFHTGEVLNYGDYTIDLTGDSCNREYGGNFIMLTKTYYGVPLRIITNGGKDCGLEYKRAHSTLWSVDQRSGLSDVARSEHPADGLDLVPSESRMLGEGRKSRRKNPPRNVIKGKLKSIDLEKGFSTSLSQRDLIQIFAGHVVNDYSRNGTRVIQQAQVLSNLVWIGNDGISRRIYDPSRNSHPFQPPPYLGPLDTGDFEIKPYRDIDENWCFAVKIDDYEIPCAIDFRSSRPNEQSLDLAQKLREHSVAVEKCLQINLLFVTEYDLFFCNLTVLDLNLERNFIEMDDGLTCYYDTIFDRKVLSCRVPKNVTDGDEITRHVLDIAWSLLTMRHIILNPLDMIRVSFKNFENNPTDFKLFSQLHGLYNDTHINLQRDLHHFYEDALIPKSTDILQEFSIKLGDPSKLPQEKEVANIICWTAFIRSKYLVAPPRGHMYPSLFEDLVNGTPDPSDFETIHHRLIENIFSDFISFMYYLNFIKGKTINYPEELRESLMEIIDRYYKIAEEKKELFSKKSLVQMEDEEKIKLSEELLKIMKDFQDEVLELKRVFDGQTLIFFLRTVGKFVERQNEILPIFDNVMVISGNKTAWEYLLQFPMEYVYKLSTECKSFNLHLGFRNAFNKTKLYPKELYINILEDLEKQRKALEDLPDLIQFGKGIKAYARTSLDLEREVYKSLQAVARAEDIKIALNKVKNFDGDVEYIKPELQKMLDVMHWTLSYLIFKSAVIDFEHRIFPFWEDVTPLFHPENVAQSLKELAKSEEGFLSHFKSISYDPENNTDKSFFTWDASVIGKKYLYDFFRGYYPLYLLAREEGEYPIPVKGYKFAVRFIPHANYTGDWLQRIKRTEIHIRPAAFSYNFFDGKTFFASSRSPRFNQVIGVGHSGLAETPVSPYTLWRVRVRKIRVDFPEEIIDKIQLVGEGLILDQNPEFPQTVRSWEPGESYEDIHFTLPKRIISSTEDLG